MAQAHYEIFLDKENKPRFRLRAPNGEIIATSEAYKVRAGCRDGIRAVQKYARYAVIQDLTVKNKGEKGPAVFLGIQGEIKDSSVNRA